MKLKLPIGIDGFEKIRTDGFYYVDKTMFIKELLENWGEVNLFTRPRRFGKTLTLDMLKSFFEIGCQKELFDGLKISQEKELCERYMGQFPVIFVTLKDAVGKNYQEAEDNIRFIIGNETKRFNFLRDSDRLTDEEKQSYVELISKAPSGGYSMTGAVLQNSLKTLSNLLAKHYGKKVILLIDEYDVPLDKAFHYGYYDEMVAFIRNMFSGALKTNKDLSFSVITGCLRISKESIFTGMNNLKVNTITDSKYAEYFGFTDDDVDELLSFYGLQSHKAVVKEWYDGYKFGSDDIYCPWDVINYCDKLRADPNTPPENYWANTSGNDLVRRFINKADFSTRDEIERLIAGEPIRKEIKQELTYRELDSSIENLWSVLFTTGYLTMVERYSARDLLLRIPNAEVRDLFVTQVKEWFKETTRADLSRIARFCSAFPAGDVELIEEMLHDYLWDSISVRDTAVRRNMKENFYHGMVLGLLQSQGNWLIKSNAELGEGYSDIMIITPERLGIVIELKYADDGNLDKACDDALAQIDDKKYAVDLGRRRIKKPLQYGIAFYEKDCKVVLAE